MTRTERKPFAVSHQERARLNARVRDAAAAENAPRPGTLLSMALYMLEHPAVILGPGADWMDAAYGGPKYAEDWNHAFAVVRLWAEDALFSDRMAYRNQVCFFMTQRVDGKLVDRGLHISASEFPFRAEPYDLCMALLMVNQLTALAGFIQDYYECYDEPESPEQALIEATRELAALLDGQARVVGVHAELAPRMPGIVVSHTLDFSGVITIADVLGAEPGVRQDEAGNFTYDDFPIYPRRVHP